MSSKFNLGDVVFDIRYGCGAVWGVYNKEPSINVKFCSPANEVMKLI